MLAYKMHIYIYIYASYMPAYALYVAAVEAAAATAAPL
jgi:hypothetical protein